MSVNSAVPHSNTLTKFVTVYPEGVVPAWMPPGYVPSRRIESSEFRFDSIAPQVGDVEAFDGHKWVVVEVQIYVPIEPSNGIKAFFIAVCSQDGIKPDRRGPGNILGLTAFEDESFPCEDGVVEYSFSDCPEYLHCDWTQLATQWLTPLNDRSDFCQVALFWCENPAAIAA